jgi:hypothetical protein
MSVATPPQGLICRDLLDSISGSDAGAAVACLQYLVMPACRNRIAIAGHENERVLQGPGAPAWLGSLPAARPGRDAPRRRFLILSFYAGPDLAWALLPPTLGFLYYYLPAATFASLALVYVLRRGNSPRWLLWAFVAVAFAGFAAMLPISATFVETSMETFNRLMIFQNRI